MASGSRPTAQLHLASSPSAQAWRAPARRTPCQAGRRSSARTATRATPRMASSPSPWTTCTARCALRVLTAWPSGGMAAPFAEPRTLRNRSRHLLRHKQPKGPLALDRHILSTRDRNPSLTLLSFLIGRCGRRSRSGMMPRTRSAPATWRSTMRECTTSSRPLQVSASSHNQALVSGAAPSFPVRAKP